jgi:hypothetical protein
VSGAVVTGEVAVVGGAMYGLEQATVGGGVAIYGEGFDRYAREERRRRDWGERDWTWAEERWRTGPGDADLAIRLGNNYNRIEGLPVHFGPEIRTGGPAPTRLQAFGIWRTDLGSPWDTEHMGYLLRAEQWFDRSGTVRLGASARSVVQPIESSHLTDVEASLAAVLFHEDFRDYYERTGWSAYLRFAPEGGPFDASVQYRDERHDTAPIRSPWTLFNGDHLWRAQPLIGEGDVRLLTATARLDLRRQRKHGFAGSGWLVDVEATRRLGGDLVVSSIPLANPDALELTAFDEPFGIAVLDVRRYQRVGWDATLGLRVVGGGALEERGLPPQFQRALGGPGSLPGYDSFDIDCGARQALMIRGNGDLGQDFFGSYGCDRFALFQAEYRGGFDFEFGGHDDDDIDWGFGGWGLGSPSWILFFDAARGWAYHADGTGLRTDTGGLYDAGAGIILGDFGIYGAVPISERSRGVNFFVRLGPRF